jgi:hypothetical protein
VLKEEWYMLVYLSVISKEEWHTLRCQVGVDLIRDFNKLKRFGLLIGFLLAPWIPAYIVKASFLEQEKIELNHRLEVSLGTVSGYIDTLFTLHQLCKEYKSSSEEQLVKNRFYQRFDTHMDESIKWRAQVSSQTVLMKNYFGGDTATLISQLMLMEAYYGFMPKEYCSKSLLSKDSLIHKEREIFQSAIKVRPFIKNEFNNIK